MPSKMFQGTDILQLLGIDFPSGQVEVRIACPKCSKGDGKRKFFFNVALGCGHCYSCGFEAGATDFYAASAQISHEEAVKDIRAKIGNKKNQAGAQSRYEPVQSGKKVSAADEKVRNAAYQNLLQTLVLTERHRTDLQGRGLTVAAIQKHGYKSYPILYRTACDCVDRLLERGCVMEGVPGFYRKEKSYKLVNMPEGYLIPVRSLSGAIQGMQLRVQTPKAPDYTKYFTFSSARYPGGTSSRAYLHYVGSDTDDTIWITEGALKANIAHEISGASVLAVPGVSSLSFVPETLRTLKKRGVRKVVVAYDMDYFINAHVQDSLKKLVTIIKDVGLEATQKIWNPEGIVRLNMDASLLSLSNGEVFSTNSDLVSAVGADYKIHWDSSRKWTISYPTVGMEAKEAVVLLKKISRAAEPLKLICSPKLECRYKGLDDYLVGTKNP